MPIGIPDAKNLLWLEGAVVSLTLQRALPSATTAVLNWTLPPAFNAYNGILIVASVREINPSNFPTDGVMYTSSLDLSAPGDMLGMAQVITALYDDVTTTQVTVTNLTPNTAYYFAAFAVSNVYTYYTPGVISYPQTGENTAFAGDMPKSYAPPTDPTVGQVYFDELQRLLFVWDGTAWVPTEAHTVITNAFDPTPGQSGLPTGYPALGDFFYNVTQHVLKCWDGTQWNAVEPSSGVPNYQKQDVGTDLSSGPRIQLANTLKHLLGYPKVCVELNDEHFNIAINNALGEIRRRTDSAYTKQYFFLQIQPFQDVYYLNDPAMGTDKIVDVVKIHRLNMLGLVNFAPDNIYAQQFLNQFYAPGVAYDLVSIHLISSLSEIYSLLFAGEVAYNWHEARRNLQIYKKFGTQEKVLIECSCEKLEQELLVDRWLKQWIQQWAKSELMLMLANIRGKFTTLPGPGGGLSLNADSLISEGTRLQEECLRQILDFETGQNGPDNFYLPMLMG